MPVNLGSSTGGAGTERLREFTEKIYLQPTPSGSLRSPPPSGREAIASGKAVATECKMQNAKCQLKTAACTSVGYSAREAQRLPYGMVRCAIVGEGLAPPEECTVYGNDSGKSVATG